MHYSTSVGTVEQNNVVGTDIFSVMVSRRDYIYGVRGNSLPMFLMIFGDMTISVSRNKLRRGRRKRGPYDVHMSKFIMIMLEFVKCPVKCYYEHCMLDKDQHTT